jgi:hypothetical protein
MATAGNTITKSSIVTDFINAVMNPANITRWHSGSYPTINYRIWTSGSLLYNYTVPVYATTTDAYGNVITYIASYTYPAVSMDTINRSALENSSVGMSNPSTANLPSAQIVASEIVNMCRSFAFETTRIRRIYYGLYYTQYGDGSGLIGQHGVPLDYAPGGVFTGTLNFGDSVAHLNSNYMVSIPGAVGSDPAAGTTVSASSINAFYSNLRYYANPYTHGVVDLRICHSSCHNNCHSSRGRR